MSKSIQELLEEYDKQMDSVDGKAYDDGCCCCNAAGISSDDQCECCELTGCLACVSI